MQHNHIAEYYSAITKKWNTDKSTLMSLESIKIKEISHKIPILYDSILMKV